MNVKEITIKDYMKRAEARVKRSDREYERAQDLIIEFTQSCNTREVIEWMKYYISSALSFREDHPVVDEIHKDIVLASNKKEAAALFLAAYDIYKSVESKFKYLTDHVVDLNKYY